MFKSEELQELIMVRLRANSPQLLILSTIREFLSMEKESKDKWSQSEDFNSPSKSLKLAEVLPLGDLEKLSLNKKFKKVLTRVFSESLMPDKQEDKTSPISKDIKRLSWEESSLNY